MKEVTVYKSWTIHMDFENKHLDILSNDQNVMLYDRVEEQVFLYLEVNDHEIGILTVSWGYVVYLDYEKKSVFVKKQYFEE